MLNKLGFYLVKNKLNREFVFLFAQFSQSEIGVLVKKIKEYKDKKLYVSTLSRFKSI